MIKFFPDLISLMVENTLRGVLKQLKEDHTPYSPPPHFAQFLSRHSGAMHIVCGYALQLLEKKDIRSLTLLLPSIATAFTKSDSVAMPDLFLHNFVLDLSAQKEMLKEGALLIVLRDFWVPCCQGDEHILLHLFRMLWYVHSKVSDALLREVMETVEPGKEVGIIWNCDGTI